MYVDPSGEFAITLAAALISAFIIASTASAISQGLEYGWDEINLLQVALDGSLAMIAVGIAATGIGILSSAGIGSLMGMGQYAASCGLHNEVVTIQGMVISGVIGGIAGAISGAGARNARLINNKLNASDVGGKGIRALTTAANRMASGEISRRGFMATFNLYGKNVFNAIQSATPGIIAGNFTTNAVKILLISAASPFAGYYGNQIYFD